MFTSDIPFNISPDKTLGRYRGGSVTSIPAIGKTFEQVIKDIAFENMNPKANLSTSGSVLYNSSNAAITVTFSAQINTPGATSKPGYPKLSFKRGSSQVWTELTNVTSPYTHILNGLTDKLSTFDYKYEVVDSNDSRDVSTSSVSVGSYITPSIAWGNTIQTGREVGDIQFSASGSVVKNSTYTTLKSWQLFYEIDGGARTPLGSPILFTENPTPYVNIETTNGTVNGINLNTSPTFIKSASRVKIYLRVIDLRLDDAEGSTDLPVLDRSLEYKKFYGSSTSAVTNYRALNMISGSTTSFGYKPYPGRFMYVALPAGKTLTSVITTNNNNVTSNFALSTTSINDAGGTPRQYNLYAWASDVSFGSDVTLNTIVQ